MATVRHVTAWAGRTKYQAAWFFVERIVRLIGYINPYQKRWEELMWLDTLADGVNP